MKILLIFLTILQILSPILSFSITCKYQTEEFPVGSLYTCHVSSLKKPKDIELTSVSGDHVGSKHNMDVEAICFEDVKELKSFPQRLGQFFPNLKAIKILNSQIKELNGPELLEVKNLQMLMMKNGKLQRIADNVFVRNRNMTHLDLQGNKIKHLGADVLSPLHLLQDVNFDNNVCLSHHITHPDQITKLVNIITTKCVDQVISEQPAYNSYRRSNFNNFVKVASFGDFRRVGIASSGNICPDTDFKQQFCKVEGSLRFFFHKQSDFDRRFKLLKSKILEINANSKG